MTCPVEKFWFRCWVKNHKFGVKIKKFEFLPKILRFWRVFEEFLPKFLVFLSRYLLSFWRDFVYVYKFVGTPEIIVQVGKYLKFPNVTNITRILHMAIEGWGIECFLLLIVIALVTQESTRCFLIYFVAFLWLLFYNNYNNHWKSVKDKD